MQEVVSFRVPFILDDFLARLILASENDEDAVRNLWPLGPLTKETFERH